MRHAPARFTLIELLVVVAIIAILAAMLLPALSKARDTVQGTQCVNNVRQISMGVILYAGDNDELTVPQGYRAQFWGGPPPPASYLAAGWSTNNGVSVWHTPLLGQYTAVLATATKPWGVIPDNSLWDCPKDTMARPDYRMAYRTTTNGGGLFFPHISQQADWDTRFKPLDRASKDPAKVITVVDGDDFTCEMTTGTAPYYGNPGNTDPLIFWTKDVPRTNINHRMRHRPYAAGDVPTGTTMGFVDGHATIIANDPSDVPGEYWLKTLYRTVLVINPNDL